MRKSNHSPPAVEGLSKTRCHQFKSKRKHMGPSAPWIIPIWLVSLLLLPGSIDAQENGLCYIDTSCSSALSYGVRDSGSGSCVGFRQCTEIWKCPEGPSSRNCGGGTKDCTFSPGCSSDMQDCLNGYCQSASSCNDRVKTEGYSHSPGINQCNCSGNPPAAGPWCSSNSLGVEIRGLGTGDVTSSPAGIDCPSGNCSSSFSYGTYVTLTAEPDPGFTFDGWGGSTVCGSGQVSVNRTYQCTAYFSEGGFSGPGTVHLTGGSLNGTSLSSSNWQITVNPNQSITGSVTVRTDNKMSSSAVAPFGYTWTWGNRTSANRQVNGDIPSGTKNWNVPINLTAPSSPGTYYILFGFNGEYNMQQVMACDNWNAGGSVRWNDGNDYHDLGTSQLQYARQNGYVNGWPYRFSDGYRDFNIPVAPIRVVVSGGGGSSYDRAYIVPVLARVAGANGTQWRTSVQVTYLEPVSVHAVFYDDSGDYVRGSLWIASKGTYNVEDYVGAAGLPSSFFGSMVWETDANLDLSVRVYNKSSSGTVGQAIPAPTLEELLESNDVGVVAFPVKNDDGGATNPYRHNIGWYQYEAGSVRTSLVSASGQVLKTRLVDLGAHTLLQDSVESFFSRPLDSTVYVEFECLSGSGFGYGSTVDNRTQDPTTRLMRRIQ